MEEEKFVKMLREDDTLEDRKNFELSTKTIKAGEKFQNDGSFSVLISEKGGEIQDILIKETHDREIDKYHCRLMVNHLIRNNIKLSDVEVTSLSDGMAIRRKSKTEFQRI